MSDYTWPSVFFSYSFFFGCLVLALFFFARSFKAGYWKKESEDIRFQPFEEDQPAKSEPQEVGHGSR